MFTWPWLNPLDFATVETGQAVLVMCWHALEALGLETGIRLEATLDRRDRSVGPFTRTPETVIEVTRRDKVIEQFNAGRIAAQVIRHGEQRAMGYWKAEVLYALRNQPVEAR
jgi:hypothetical protein